MHGTVEGGEKPSRRRKKKIFLRKKGKAVRKKRGKVKPTMIELKKSEISGRVW